MDSGYSRHMTSDVSQFLCLIEIDEGDVTFGSNKKCKIIGIGKVALNSNFCLDNVYIVKVFKHNFLSISQLCDKNYKVVFDHLQCTIYDNDDKILFI